MAKKTAPSRTDRSVRRLGGPASATPTAVGKSLNHGLSAAKAAKQDEFYTQYIDIQKEVEAYLEYDADTFRGKVVYCNCDDPYESNFFKFFAANFNRLGLKKLIATSYDGSPIAGQQTLFPEYDQDDDKRARPHAIAIAVEIEEVKDLNGDGITDIDDVKIFLDRNPHSRTQLKGGGDFRSDECIELLKQADIVITNPPFSLFREFVTQLVEHGKQFLIIGNQNAIKYKGIFELIQENKLWLGVSIHSGDREFGVPNHYPLNAAGTRVDELGNKYIRVKGVRWFTNIDHGRRHEKLLLMSTEHNLKYSKHKELKGKPAYERYANYDAIEIPYSDSIPSDCNTAMGVPITFLDKYNPDQFEILGTNRTIGVTPMSEVAQEGTFGVGGPCFYLANGDGTFRRLYDRIVIRHRTRVGKGSSK
jgi:hypothetical protein